MGFDYWIDVHTHLDQLETSPEEALELALAQGVRQVITIGTSEADHATVLALAQKHPQRVYCSLGVHPHHGSEFTENTESWIEREAIRPEVVAVGEIGLDYYYKHSEPQAQKESFDRQLALAERLQLPVEIHTRDAEADTVEILRNYRGRVKGLLHCFTGTQWLADQALDLGFNISFSGVLTFKTAHELRAVCERVPVDRMHVETDAPYLAPVPHRGKKNTPAFVVETGQWLAQIKKLDVSEIRSRTTENSRRLFSKIAEPSKL